MRVKGSVLAIAIFLLSVVLVISCSSPGNEDQPAIEVQTGSNFKVAVLLPHSKSDSGWNQQGYEGLQAIKQQLGATVAYKENVDMPSPQPPAVFEKAFQEYGQAGYDLIIGHGGEFISSLEAAAKKFPRSKFAIIGGYAGNNVNSGGITYRANEAGYLTGVVAGLTTKTNKITVIGGQRVADGQDFAKFYERGAKAINPKVTVSVNWVGSFTDVAKGTELAEAEVKSGVDVLIVIADLLASGVIKVAQSAGVKVITIFSDQYNLAPKTVIANLLVKYPAIYVQAATLVRQGRWEGKQYRFGFKEGAIELTSFRGNLTPEQEAKVNAVKQEILLNKINLSS